MLHQDRGVGGRISSVGQPEPRVTEVQLRNSAERLESNSVLYILTKVPPSGLSAKSASWMYRLRGKVRRPEHVR